MSDAQHQVPPDPEESYLDGSEAVGNGEDVTKEASQALMPSDLDEPALTNGTSGDDAGD